MGFNDININVSGPIQPTATYKTKVLKGNHSFASQVTEPNMKYIIKYNYELLDATLTMPQNVILEFDGGSIKNGTLVGNDTLMLNTNETESVLDNVTLDGTWKESSYDLVEEVVADKAPGDGMGRIILRKDKTFAEQLIQENTIYVIRYDFELTEDVTIPANCVLEFEGGSVSGNNIVTFTDTLLLGEVKCYCDIDGLLRNDTIIPDWFVENVSIKNNAIQKAINVAKPNSTIKFISPLYFSDSGIIVSKIDLKFLSECHSVLKRHDGLASNYFFNCYNNGGTSNGVVFDGIIFDTREEEDYSGEDKPYFYIIRLVSENSTREAVIRNCTFYSVGVTAVQMNSNGGRLKVINNNFYQYQLTGTKWNDCSTLYINCFDKTVYGNYFEDRTNKEAHTAVEIHGFQGIISNNTVEGFNCAFIVMGEKDRSIIRPNDKEAGYVVNSNNAHSCRNTLISIWSIQYTKNIIITNNIGTDLHRFAIDFHVAPDVIGTIENVTIANNQFIFDEVIRTLSHNGEYTESNCFAINLATNSNIKHICISNNIFINVHAGLIIAKSPIYTLSCDKIYIDNNYINVIGFNMLESFNDTYVKLYVAFLAIQNIVGKVYFISNKVDFDENVLFHLYKFSNGYVYAKDNLYNNIIQNDADTLNIESDLVGGTFFNPKGEVHYNSSLEKLIFVGQEANGQKVFEQSNIAVGTHTYLNTLEENVLYTVNSRYPGSKFGFSKTENPTEDELYLIYSGGYNGTLNIKFIGVNPSVYPYIYISNTDETHNIRHTVYKVIKQYELDGAIAGVNRSGVFADKPLASDIYIGFKYFCTDKQTVEGATDGIEIIHKGNDVWVDALGRVVS